MLNENLTNLTEGFDVEDIEDFEVNEEITYLVCALGYNKDDKSTVCEVYLQEFKLPDEAIAFAKTVDLAALLHYAADQQVDISETAYFSLEVETVICDPDEEDGGTVNIDTVYQRVLWLGGEYSPDEDTHDYNEDIVTTCAGDYELLDDGTLKLKAEFMKGFNKNDIIRVKFIDENDTYPLPYKIMSKVIYEDSVYFLCELML